MIEKRLQTLEEAVLKLTVAVRELNELGQALIMTNPDTSAFIPDVVKRRRARTEKSASKQALIELFNDYCKKLGNDKGLEILELYGVRAIAQLPEEHWGDVFNLIKTEME